MRDSPTKVTLLLDSVRHSLRHHRVATGPLLLALSGGGDSTALFRALLELLGPHRLRVAHLNHQLRGPESDADAAFVAELCARWHVPLVSASVPLQALSTQAGVGTEAAARSVRYDFLKQAALDLGCHCIATGHTADDQAETVLLRTLRGTGLAGLAGIPPVRDLGDGVRLIRPLLPFTRLDLLDCLQHWQQPYRVDSSNTLPDATRTRVRLELLPQLRRDFNPQLDRCLLSLATQAREIQDWIGEQVVDLLKGVDLQSDGNSLSLKWESLLRLPDFLIAEVLITLWDRMGWPRRLMTHRHWRRLTAVVRSGRRAEFPGRISAVRLGPRLELRREA